jgi:hypothetical protein
MDAAATSPARPRAPAADPYDRFIAKMNRFARNAPSAGSWHEYEAYKAHFLTTCPGATPAQHQAAMRAAARAAGV